MLNNFEFRVGVIFWLGGVCRSCWSYLAADTMVSDFQGAHTLKKGGTYSSQQTFTPFVDSRVILNGQFWMWCGCGVGAAQAQWRRWGHRGHARLKFEKYDHLTKRVSGAPKTIADKKLRKSVQGGAWKAKKRDPPCAWGFYVGISIILSIVAQTSTLTPWSTFIYDTIGFYICITSISHPQSHKHDRNSKVSLSWAG